MENASIAAAMAEKDADAQRLVQQVAVAKALSLVGQGQIDAAIQDLTALRDQNPKVADVRLGLAKALIAKRQVDAAITELKEAVSLDPGLAEAQFQLGLANHVYKGNANAALEPFEKAVAADPSNLEYRTSLGNALAAVGQADRGISELTKVTQSPSYAKADAWTYLGGALLNAKRYKDAVAPLEKAISIKPENELAYRYLAWLYFGLKRGGPWYYALDVTGRAPRVLWKAGSSHLDGLAEAWSAPTIARVRIAGTKQDAQGFVVIVGGGFSPDSSATGNRILMLDAATGRLLWSAGNHKGADRLLSRMGYGIATRIVVLDTDRDELADRMYAADMGGQIWRFDIWNGRDPSQLVTGGVLANLGAAEPRAAPATAADARRFFNAPDIAFIRPRGGNAYYNLAIGSGGDGRNAAAPGTGTSPSALQAPSSGEIDMRSATTRKRRTGNSISINCGFLFNQSSIPRRDIIGSRKNSPAYAVHTGLCAHSGMRFCSVSGGWGLYIPETPRGGSVPIGCAPKGGAAPESIARSAA